MAVPANQTEDVKSRLLRSALFMLLLLLLHLISNATAPTINEATANKAGMSHSIWLSVSLFKRYTLVNMERPVMFLGILFVSAMLLLCIFPFVMFRSLSLVSYSPWPVNATSTEPITILIPHSRREDFAVLLCEHLSAYLPRAHPKARSFQLVFVEQTDRDPGDFYCKGLSWNVGLRYLLNTISDDNTPLVLQDVDAVPLESVDYSSPPEGTTMIWFMTTGGMKTRLSSLQKCNGYTMVAKGWGVEDVACWDRLERVAREKTLYWPAALRAAVSEVPHPVIANLEWGADVAGDELASRQKWYWGEQRDVVEMVSQADSRVMRKVPVPSRVDWNDDTRANRNRTMNEIIRALPHDEFQALTEKDGLSSLPTQPEIRVTAFETRFPQVRLSTSDGGSGVAVKAINISFESRTVLGRTHRNLMEDLSVGWYIRDAPPP